jgi:hypothetical protein
LDQRLDLWRVSLNARPTIGATATAQNSLRVERSKRLPDRLARPRTIAVVAFDEERYSGANARRGGSSRSIKMQRGEILNVEKRAGVITIIR